MYICRHNHAVFYDHSKNIISVNSSSWCGSWNGNTGKGGKMLFMCVKTNGAVYLFFERIETSLEIVVHAAAPRCGSHRFVLLSSLRSVTAGGRPLRRSCRYG